MSNSPFDAVQELDEEQDEGDDDDQDVFIKVNVDRKQAAIRVTGTAGSEDDETSDEEGVEDEEEEEQDMATLLASQEQRRLKAYGRTTTTTTTTSPSPAGLARTGLSPQMVLSSNSGTPIKSPLSWAFRGTHDAASATSSYNVRMAASGISGATAVAGGGAVGGLTVGYGTPRRRPFKASRDLNGTGRRTWTGGHSIIYSGIFVDDESDDDDDNDEDRSGGGRDGNEASVLGGTSDVEGEDVDANEKLEEAVEGGVGERNEKEDGGGDVVVAVDHSQEESIFDDTIKAEIDSSIKTSDTETGVSVDIVKLEGIEQDDDDDDDDDVKVEDGSGAGATVKIGITETTKRATVRETKTVHRHGLKIIGPGHSEDGSIVGDLVDVDGRLVVGEVVVVDGDIDQTSKEGVVDGVTKPGSHPRFNIPLPAGDDAENATAIDRPLQGMPA